MPHHHHHYWLHEAIAFMQTVQHEGWVGWILFILLYAAACLFFVPGSIFTLSAGAIYGWWGGLTLVLLGNGLGSLLSLLVSRYLLRGWIRKKIDQHETARAISEAVEQEGWRIVFFTRLSPFMPFSLINYALGVTRISVIEFFVATELGAVPSICVYVYIGTLIGSLAQIGPDMGAHRPLEWTVWGIGLLITVGVTIYVTRIASQTIKRHMH